MTKKKIAIFCHRGLGDGVISTILSNNFHQNNWETVTYQDTMVLLQSWFPHLLMRKYPPIDTIPSLLEENDLLVVFQHDTHDFVLELIEQGKRICPEKVLVIYPYPSKNILKNPYYNDSKIDPTLSFVDNLFIFCRDLMQFEKTTKNNGMIPPRGVELKKHEKRVVMHVSSSRPGRNWPIEKFLCVAKSLMEDGFDVSILAGIGEEQKPFLPLAEQGFCVPKLSSLSEVAKYVCESKYHIGNDSGLGHLASCFGLDTLTVARRKAVGLFWRPGWGNNIYLTPPRIIPNFSRCRLRDKYWKSFISPRKVYRKFMELRRKAA